MGLNEKQILALCRSLDRLCLIERLALYDYLHTKSDLNEQERFKLTFLRDFLNIK